MSNARDQALSSDLNDHLQDDNATATTDRKVYDGYPKLGNLMGSYPTTAIFRRFGELNMLNLLRLQAELQDLEHQLQEIRDEDDFTKSKDPIRTSYVTDFRLMRDWKNDGDSLQYDLLVSIGEKLREYSIIFISNNMFSSDSADSIYRYGSTGGLQAGHARGSQP